MPSRSCAAEPGRRRRAAAGAAAGRRSSSSCCTSRVASASESCRMTVPVVRALGAALAAAEQRDGQRACRRADARRPSARPRRRTRAEPAITIARGRKFAEHVGQAGQAGDRQAQRLGAGAAEEEVQRGGVERGGVELAARSRRRPGRSAGAAGDGAMRRARTSQSVAQPAANAQGALPSPWRSAISCSDGSRTSSTARSTERSASAASIAASARSSSQAVSAPDEHRRVCGQVLARARDGGGDRQALLQRVAQRGDLAVRVQTVLALGAASASGSRNAAPTRAACSG